MPTINILERRPQRDPIVVTDGNGHSYEWPSVPPLAVTIFFLRMAGASKDPTAAADAARPAYVALFGADNVDEAMRLFSLSEIDAIASEVYKVTSGESSASPDS